MELPEHYSADLLFFFQDRPLELSLYERLAAALAAALPGLRVKVQKSQISFYGRHLFAAASLPLRRKKDWPRQCLLVSFGLGFRLDSPRIALSTEPYPRRWTHHVVVARPEEIDEELLGWLEAAWRFAEEKR
ncbi:DUF5655 domain-containing protein [Flavonifractor hominis]|uniref:DUF5655 domain-containing protein n=1 Tax=Flavonifractor hominis TaxID=3133178 RepID=A0ABV1ENX5_9FIRM